METSTSVQPIFDPNKVGASFDYLQARLPIHGTVFSGQVVGDTTMRVHGEGTERRDIRDYEIGDNTRHLDWKATAKHPMGKLQVIDHNRDIKPNFILITDVLQSRYEHITADEEYFSERNLAMSACLGLLQIATKQGLPGRALAINDKGIVGPTKFGRGSSHLMGTARTLVKGMSHSGDMTGLLSASPETVVERPRLADLLAYAGKNCANSLVAVVSDFRDAGPEDDENGWRQSLRNLKARHNSIISVTINSPSDEKLSEDQARFATDHGVIYVPKGKKGQAQRDRYAELHHENLANITSALKSVQAHRISLSTADPKWATSLRSQLMVR